MARLRVSGVQGEPARDGNPLQSAPDAHVSSLRNQRRVGGKIDATSTAAASTPAAVPLAFGRSSNEHTDKAKIE